MESKISVLSNKLDNLATKADIARLEGKLESKINESKSETIKWMFIFWVGQAAVTFGYILLYLKNNSSNITVQYW